MKVLYDCFNFCYNLLHIVDGGPKGVYRMQHCVCGR